MLSVMTVLCCVCVVLVMTSVVVATVPEGVKPNVLMLIADDWRPEVGAYGRPVHTPNVDALAEKGYLFNRAYCQISVCAPSRNSLFSGRRPSQTQSWNFINNFREAANGTNVASMPQWFKMHGYTALGLGKTYHPGVPPNYDEPLSWSQVRDYFPMGQNHCPHGGEGGGICHADPDKIWDTSLATNTVETLRWLKSSGPDAPFFVASGFRIPHAPWASPTDFWNLYDPSKIAVPTNQYTPKDMPDVAFIHNFDVKLENGTTYFWNETVAVPENVMQIQYQAYRAAVSYMDSLIGEIIGELDTLGYGNNTIVVVTADHGYHLAEHNEWEKKSNFDLTNRVPLIIYSPFASHSNVTVDSFYEHVDLYPTLAGLAGLPSPIGPEGLDSTDLSPLFDDPTAQSATKPAAFYLYPRCNTLGADDSCNNVARTEFEWMGYSIRTAGWRLTEWLPWNTTSLKPIKNGTQITELYAHTDADLVDFSLNENANVASDPKHAETLKDLHAQLWAQFGKYT